MSSIASVHLRDFQEIAHDQNNQDVALYEQLDQTDQIKLISATANLIPMSAWSDFIQLGWIEVQGQGDRVCWKSSWIEKLKATQLLAPFYVYLKRLTNS